MLKNDQTYLKSFVVYTLQEFQSKSGHFSMLYMKELVQLQYQKFPRAHSVANVV